jgi:hypothetical protein
VHSTYSEVPGWLLSPLQFTKAHLYYGGGWQNFSSDRSGTPGNPKSGVPSLVYSDDGTPNCQAHSTAGGSSYQFFTWGDYLASTGCNPFAPSS